MRISELKAYVETAFTGQKFLVNQFHGNAPDNCNVIVLGSAGFSTREIGNVAFQFLIRHVDPEQAESIAMNIHKHFNNKTGYMVGTNKIVFSRGQQAVPLYTGIDANNRHIYSVNIEVRIDQ